MSVVGAHVSNTVGCSVGFAVAVCEGAIEGASDGRDVGLKVGARVGAADGFGGGTLRTETEKPVPTMESSAVRRSRRVLPDEAQYSFARNANAVTSGSCTHRRW